MPDIPQTKQLLHPVFGGELNNVADVTFIVRMHRLLGPQSAAPQR
jgi:hypothetical protein